LLVLESDDRAPDPWKKVVVVAFTSFKQPNQEWVGLTGTDLELEAIEAQKNIGGEKGDALVSIYKRMIHD